MQVPRYRNEWTPTTIVAIFTLITMIIGVGALWQRLEGRIDLAVQNISQLTTNVTVLDQRTLNVPNLEYRMGQTEAAIVAGQKRGDERTKEITTLRDDMNKLNTSIQLILQSLQRLEAAAGVRDGEPIRKK